MAQIGKDLTHIMENVPDADAATIVKICLREPLREAQKHELENIVIHTHPYPHPLCVVAGVYLRRIPELKNLPWVDLIDALPAEPLSR